MPQGKGTYGSKVGRPSKSVKKNHGGKVMKYMGGGNVRKYKYGGCVMSGRGKSRAMKNGVR